MRGPGALLLAFLALAPWATAAEPQPAVSIIIDDLGDRLDTGTRAVRLPAPVTCAVLPGTPFAVRLATMASVDGKEVMLHLPMESVAGLPPGPGALTLHMTQAAFTRTLVADLAAIPQARGVNNHMGSLITRHPGHMKWLMEKLADRGVYFVDSRTTSQTVAQRLAVEQGVRNTSRDLFLDYRRERGTIERQLARLVAMARNHGTALGIAHPYPETLDVLERMLPRLGERGVRIVPVSELIHIQDQRRLKLWRASLSPLPTAAKNSKP